MNLTEALAVANAPFNHTTATVHAAYTVLLNADPTPLVLAKIGCVEGYLHRLYR